MRKLESTRGFSFLSGSGGQRVTKRSSSEDWMRRLLIALACFWLLVGVVLPLLDVVDRATHIELVVKIEEPDEAKAMVMMRAIGPFLEKHHNVMITDEALADTVHLSSRYITGRQLPDKLS